MNKRCTKCKEIKAVNLFGFNKKAKDKLTSWCKHCISIQSAFRQRQRRQEDPEYRLLMSAQRAAVIYKQYHSNLEYKDSMNKKSAAYYARRCTMDPNYIPLLREKSSIYGSKRYKTDIFYKFKSDLSSGISRTFKNSGYSKDARTESIVGCSFDMLKLYIESKFTSIMTWENKGVIWHVDHICPIAQAKTKEEVYLLWHYSNLQPLLAYDNLSKSNKATPSGILLCQILLKRDWI